MSKLSNVWKLGVIGLVAATGVAHAEDRDPEMQGPPTKSPVRVGATVTLSFGPGEMHLVPKDSKEQRTEGAAFSLRAGSAISEKAAFEGIIDFVKGSGQQSSIFGGSIKFYAGDALYIRPGAGIAMFSYSGMDGMGGSSTERDYGVAALFGVGYEWFQLRDIALFGEFEMTGGRMSRDVGGGVSADYTLINAALNFGITWF